MEDIKTWSELFLTSLQNLWLHFVDALPSILAGITLIVLGLLLAWLARLLMVRFLRLVKFDSVQDKFKGGSLLQPLFKKRGPSQWIGKLVYWVVLLVFLVGATEALGLAVISAKIAEIIGYLPKLISGLAILAIGIYLANALRTLIHVGGPSIGLSASRLIGNIAFYVLLAIVGLTGLEQMGVNIDLLKSNFIIILGGVALTLALSYGLGSRAVVANILSGFYAKRHLRPGQSVRIREYEGQILKFEGPSIVLLKKNGEQCVIPASWLSSESIEILSDPEI